MHSSVRCGLAVTAATLALSVAACGDSAEPASSGPAPKFAAGTTMAKIAKRGKLIVGTAYDTPLFSVKNPITDKVEGFDADFARRLAADLTGSADNVEFVLTAAENREPFLQTGKVDVVLETYSITPERKKVVSFAGPYYIAGQQVLVNKAETTIQSVSDLDGKSVCVVAGTTTQDNVEKVAPQARISPFTGSNTCVEGVKDGRFDAYVDDGITLVGNVQQDPDKLKLVGQPFTKEPYGIGLGHGDEAFRCWLSKEVATMLSDGDWDKLYDANVRKAGVGDPLKPTPAAC